MFDQANINNDNQALDPFDQTDGSNSSAQTAVEKTELLGASFVFIKRFPLYTSKSRFVAMNTS